MSYERLGASTKAKSLSAELPRANVLGVGVHALDLDLAAQLVLDAIAGGRKGYVCVTGIHGIVQATRDPQFRRALDSAYLVVPDGMPTVWVGRMQGYAKMDRVFGPDLFLEVCKRSVETGSSHFLYGGNPGVAEKLEQNLRAWFPSIRVAGTDTPPFRPLSSAEGRSLQEKLRRASPDILWIGLSTPKQERFMAEYLPLLPCKIMIGIGAAFDYHTGRLKDAPRWVKRSGLQWLHRLCQEPKRLWKRYLVNNSLFLTKLALQVSGVKRYELSHKNAATAPLTHHRQSSPLQESRIREIHQLATRHAAMPPSSRPKA